MSPAFILPSPSASTLAPRTYALYFALVGVSLAIVGLVLVLIVSFAGLCAGFDAFQSGYCTPCQIMSAIGCVEEGHAGSDAEIHE